MIRTLVTSIMRLVHDLKLFLSAVERSNELEAFSEIYLSSASLSVSTSLSLALALALGSVSVSASAPSSVSVSVSSSASYPSPMLSSSLWGPLEQSASFFLPKIGQKKKVGSLKNASLPFEL